MSNSVASSAAVVWIPVPGARKVALHMFIWGGLVAGTAWLGGFGGFS